MNKLTLGFALLDTLFYKKFNKNKKNDQYPLRDEVRSIYFSLPDEYLPNKVKTKKEPPYLSSVRKTELVLKGVALGDCAGRTHEGVSPDRCREEVSIENLYKDNPDCTDDTILTCATIDNVLFNSSYCTEASYGEAYRHYARKYPRSDYGMRFSVWVEDNDTKPHSFGNGSAMRVSPCGCFDDIGEVIVKAYKSALCTHDHPEGIKGAIVTAVCVWMAFNGYSKKEIGDYCASHYQDSPYSPKYSYKTISNYKELKGSPVTCQVTVPMAVTCFVHSESFEDCILKAIHMGWDTDTQAAIAGSIAAAYYQSFSDESNNVYEELKDLPYIKQVEDNLSKEMICFDNLFTIQENMCV